MRKIYAVSDGDECCGEKIRRIGNRGRDSIFKRVVRKGLTEKVTFEPRPCTPRQ